jgi:hypothetical protein
MIALSLVCRAVKKQRQPTRFSITLPLPVRAPTGDSPLFRKENMKKSKKLLGWREWVALPEIGIQRIKAKIDTGARTSCLHAFYVEPLRKNRKQYVRFGVHPLQRDRDQAIHCEAEIIDQRQVTDSGGHRELRFVIQTRLQLLHYDDAIEITLTNRDSMRFRMLLGRTAMAKASFYVDPSRSYLGGKP